MKKAFSILLCLAMILSLMAGCSSGEKPAAANSGETYKIALITMDSIDQHWITLKEGAEKAAAELGVELTFMAPNTKDDALQIEQVNNAVSAGNKAIIVAANGPDAISSALKEAEAAGVKIIYVDSPANVEAEATFSTDNTAAGKTAGETMLDALTEKGVTSGKIGIVNVNAATASCVARENGFRSAFEGTGFELLETQYGEGDAAKSQSIAENYITQGVVGIFGCNEGSTNGAGNAVKAAGADVVCVGFDKSDAILGLIDDGYILATMAQNPDVMGYEGVKAAVAALKGENLGGAVTDTGVSVLKASSSAAPTGDVKPAGDYKIALITMDSIDQHWITLKEGAEKVAKELGVELVFMAPNTKDDAQQIEQVNNAVAAGCNAIIVAANGPDAISSALKEASAAGVKIVYVDSPANVEAEATFSTDNTAAGKTAGETMLDALTEKGITSGKIGIVNVNAATASCVARESGFRSAFEGTGFELLETQYGEGDAAKSQSIAENYITQGVVGIFGCNEGSTNGAGNAVKAAGADVVCVGFDKSDAILGLIDDGYILATMAQNPDVMGYEGVKAAVAALKGENLGGAVTDTGVSVLKASSSAAPTGDVKPAGDYKIALITMDSIDQHWITLKEGAEKVAKELGVELVFMAPNTKDDAQQIEQVNNAVAAGCNAIIVAANGPDAISSALKEASAAGVKIVYVDSPANVEAEATFSTDNTAAGKTAGETMLKALTDKGITSGKIGIVNVNAATASCVARENGFRSAFEGTGFELLETQYGEGDAAKSQGIAENYITQGVVGIFGCNEGSTNGAGNAVKAAGAEVVCVGFDKSDAILGLIQDGYILATMAQNPDVMGAEGVKAAVAALNGENLGGAVTDTGVSVLTK